MRQYGRLKITRLSLYSVLEEPSINEAEPINGKKGEENRAQCRYVCEKRLITRQF